MGKSRKMPRDLNELASKITKIATGEEEEPDETEGKNPAAVALGRLGGLKGGNARAKKLSSEKRKEIARNAARKRWRSREQN